VTKKSRAGRAGVSEAASRYLEAIFYIEGEGETARPARLAEWLGVAQPTITAGLARLTRDGLIRMGPGRAVQFTPEGRRAAETIVRKHRIAERWLTDMLHLDWLEADIEASRLEHAMSVDLAERLYTLIGKPETCPHGNAIPGVAQTRRRAQRALASLQPGDTARLRRISEVAEHEAPDLLRFLSRSGFSLGGEIELIDASAGAGTVTVRVSGGSVSMSSEVAKKIWVDAA